MPVTDHEDGGHRPGAKECWGWLVRRDRRSESFVIKRGVTTEREVAGIPGRGHEPSNRVNAEAKGGRNDSPLVGRKGHTLTLVQ